MSLALANMLKRWYDGRPSSTLSESLKLGSCEIGSNDAKYSNFAHIIAGSNYLESQLN